VADSELQIRTEISQVTTELTDSDLVFEVSANTNRSISRDAVPVRAIQDAIEATLLAFRTSVRTHVERVAVLEEVSRGCVTIWFRFHAYGPPRGSDVVARPADADFLKYMGHGLLAFLSWLEGRSPRLSQLQHALQVLASGMLTPKSPFAKSPTSVDLASAVAAWAKVKGLLDECDSARVLLQQGSTDLDFTKSVPEITGLFERKLVNRAVEMIVLVERPDYAGAGEWLLKHGQARFTARCCACEVLDRFYRRQIDIRPGDALHCTVEFDTFYGPDNEVLNERLSVVDVIEVLSASPSIIEGAQPIAAREQNGRTAQAPDRMLVL
jgi:hypothetical protein